ncbi:MAG: hypothetical protein GXY44_14680 [Phycisphaerales bacterium]|nr:hypothetical protein [Phycisphaerales bacterium]
MTRNTGIVMVGGAIVNLGAAAAERPQTEDPWCPGLPGKSLILLDGLNSNRAIFSLFPAND